MLILPDQGEVLLGLARRAVRRSLSDLPVEDITPENPALHVPAGCFCSLHSLENHRLRGCVGQLDASQPLFQCVQRCARAVLKDPRFVNVPVQLDELPRLSIELSIVSPMTAAQDPMDFDLASDGILLSVNGRSGCFLPQVARETGWDKQTLLARLCTEKMGLPADAWRDPGAQLQKFSTQIVGPAAF